MSNIIYEVVYYNRIGQHSFVKAYTLKEAYLNAYKNYEEDILNQAHPLDLIEIYKYDYSRYNKKDWQTLIDVVWKSDWYKNNIDKEVVTWL